MLLATMQAPLQQFLQQLQAPAQNFVYAPRGETKGRAGRRAVSAAPSRRRIRKIAPASEESIQFCSTHASPGTPAACSGSKESSHG